LAFNSISGEIIYDVETQAVEGNQESALQTLHLDDNSISGKFPFEGFKSLVSLSLSPNNISGSLPDEIGLLNHLESLSLIGSTKFTGTLPSTLAYLTNLKRLSLSYVDFSGTIPETIGNMTSLSTFKCMQSLFYKFVLNLKHISSHSNQ
jgi:hypothetical protein